MASPPPPASAASSSGHSGFLIVLVVGAIVISAAVGYLGLTGRLGGGIPGTSPGSGEGGAPAAHCEGGDSAGKVSLSFVAQATSANSDLNFNGTSPGPCVLVAAGANVTVNFSVSASANMNHSWVLIPYPSGTASSSPAFPGAGFAGGSATNGIAPGTFRHFVFTAATAGAYRYICEMPGHYAGGMWGWFNVSATSSAYAALPAMAWGHGPAGTPLVSRAA